MAFCYQDILYFLLQYPAKILHRRKIKFRVSSISKLQGEQVHTLEFFMSNTIPCYLAPDIFIH